MDDDLELMLADMRKAHDKSNGHVDGTGSLDIPDAAEFPKLTAMLTRLPTSGASVTKPGAVTLFIQDGRLTACVSYPAMASRAFVALDGYGDALWGLEKALASRSVKWGPEKKKGWK